MYKQVSFTIKGVSPLLMHNGRLANPRDPIVKESKRLTPKRNKTDDDLALLSKIEWFGGIYTTEDFGFEVKQNDIEFFGGGYVCLPGDVIESSLIASARKQKLGKQAQSGMFIQGDFLLDFPGSKTEACQLFVNEYVDVRKVNVQKNSIMRTRPIFKEWGLTFEVSYLSDVLNLDQIRTMVETCGRMIGFCDYRPKYGRFEVV